MIDTNNFKPLDVINVLRGQEHSRLTFIEHVISDGRKIGLLFRSKSNQDQELCYILALPIETAYGTRLDPPWRLNEKSYKSIEEEALKVLNGLGEHVDAEL